MSRVNAQNVTHWNPLSIRSHQSGTNARDVCKITTLNTSVNEEDTNHALKSYYRNNENKTSLRAIDAGDRTIQNKLNSAEENSMKRNIAKVLKKSRREIVKYPMPKGRGLFLSRKA